NTGNTRYLARNGWCCSPNILHGPCRHSCQLGPLPPVSAAATVPSITTTAAALAACTFSLLAAFSSPHRLLLRLRVQLYLLLAVAAAALHTESPFSSLTPTLTHIVRPLPTASASVTLAATSVTTAAAAAAAAITAEALTERNLLA
ncbi:unnamed protein product, partial [Closterium sp. NIES-54]